jgi:acyl-CoA synthetase (AMP-forming)/AMP-acid ligase II
MDADEIFRMAFTSGTTGDPKCVLHSFNSTLYAGYVLNTDMKVTPEDVMLVYLPVGLNWGYLCVLQTIMAGARAVLFERFSARGALGRSRRNASPISRPRQLRLSPLSTIPTSRNLIPALRVITGGASAPSRHPRFPVAYQRKPHRALRHAGDGPAHTRFTDDPQKVNGTIGRVVGEMELRIIDEAGNDVPHGEIGEIAARGPTVHLGYHNNSSANASAFIKGGWFRTGDLGRYVDTQNNVQITGRSKEIINRGGKKFFPREVEEILYTHPKILHAAIVGIPDQRLGERNCLCVVPKPQQQLALGEVVSFLKGQVADYKLPEMIEQFDDLPMTGTGKIRRHILRDLVTARWGGRSRQLGRALLDGRCRIMTARLQSGRSRCDSLRPEGRTSRPSCVAADS